MAFTKINDAAQYVDDAGIRQSAKAVVALTVDSSGNPTSPTTKKQYTLLTNASALGAGPWVGPIDGGDYVWRTEGNFNGGTATLQFQGLDGVTAYPVKDSANADVALTATGSKSIGVAQGAFLRVNVTGAAPVGLNSVIGGL